MKILEYQTLKYIKANYHQIINTHWPTVINSMQNKLQTSTNQAVSITAEALTYLGKLHATERIR